MGGHVAGKLLLENIKPEMTLVRYRGMWCLRITGWTVINDKASYMRTNYLYKTCDSSSLTEEKLLATSRIK